MFELIKITEMLSRRPESDIFYTQTVAGDYLLANYRMCNELNIARVSLNNVRLESSNKPQWRLDDASNR